MLTAKSNLRSLLVLAILLESRARFVFHNGRGRYPMPLRLSDTTLVGTSCPGGTTRRQASLSAGLCSAGSRVSCSLLKHAELMLTSTVPPFLPMKNQGLRAEPQLNVSFSRSTPTSPSTYLRSTYLYGHSSFVRPYIPAQHACLSLITLLHILSFKCFSKTPFLQHYSHSSFATHLGI